MATAVTQLSAPTPQARLAAVGQNGIFLRSSKSQHAIALTSLVAALPVERDPIVKSTILLNLQQAQGAGVDRSILVAVFDQMVTMNKAIVDGYIASFRMYDTYDAREGDRPLTRELVLDVVQSNNEGLLGVLQKDTSLSSINSAFHVLLKRGITPTNFDGAYCESCDFTSVKDMKGYSFRHSILRDARFDGVNLTNANFHDAVLSGVSFIRSNLSAADLSDEPIYDELLGPTTLPTFACAILRDADFNNRSIFRQTLSYMADNKVDLDFYGSNFDGAKDVKAVKSLSASALSESSSFAAPADFMSGASYVWNKLRRLATTETKPQDVQKAVQGVQVVEYAEHRLFDGILPASIDSDSLSQLPSYVAYMKLPLRVPRSGESSTLSIIDMMSRPGDRSYESNFNPERRLDCSSNVMPDSAFREVVVHQRHDSGLR